MVVQLLEKETHSKELLQRLISASNSYQDGADEKRARSLKERIKQQATHGPRNVPPSMAGCLAVPQVSVLFPAVWF